MLCNSAPMTEEHFFSCPALQNVLQIFFYNSPYFWGNFFYTLDCKVPFARKSLNRHNNIIKKKTLKRYLKLTIVLQWIVHYTFLSKIPMHCIHFGQIKFCWYVINMFYQANACTWWKWANPISCLCILTKSTFKKSATTIFFINVSHRSQYLN